VREDLDQEYVVQFLNTEIDPEEVKEKLMED